MSDQRRETRLLCSELVTVSWPGALGCSQAIANLEDISPSGACFQLDIPIPVGETITLHHPNGDLFGPVRYCRLSDIGFYIGVEFDPSVVWEPADYQPDHLTDPRAVPAAPQPHETA